MAQEPVTKEAVLEQLKQVFDPEIPINVVDLGLIYDVNINQSNVTIEMTLTAPGCSVGPYIAQQAEWAISEIDEVENVQVEMVFDPPWSPEMITEEAKLQLGID